MGRIVLEHVSKEFPGGVQAVRDVSLEIDNGEFMVLVGPSGCGKTTILRMIAGLDEVTDGEVTIGDRVVTDDKPKDRDIAMVFQNYALYPHMTVEQNIGFGMRLRRTPKPVIRQRVGGAAEVLGLLDYLARKPADLSGGQRQRVAIGRAMVREPQAFLMDEPLSNLDAKLRVQMRTELARLHKQLATTIVYVTHDQVEAMTLGTRVAVVRDGVLQQVDTPQALFHHPVNLFVAGFIGSPTMNLVEAAVTGDKLEFGGHRLPLPAGGDLDAYNGRRIILGIRPSDFEDAEVWRDERLPVVEVTAEVVEDLGRCHLLEPAVSHDRHPVAHRHGLDLVVRDVDRGGAELALQRRDLGAGLRPQLGVEVRQRLVHQEHRRVADDGPAHGDPLALAARELAGLAVEPLLELQHLGCVEHPLADLVLRQLGQLQREADVLLDRHVRVERVVLEHHGDVALLGRQVVDDPVADAELTRRDGLEARDHAQGRRLAAARRADEHEELAVGDVEVEVDHGGHPVGVDLRHLVHGHHSHRGPPEVELVVWAPATGLWTWRRTWYQPLTEPASRPRTK